MTDKKEEPKEEVIKANEEIQQILDKYNVQIQPQMDFPIYKIYPESLQLALKVLEQHNPKFGIVLQPKAK